MNDHYRMILSGGIRAKDQSKTAAPPNRGNGSFQRVLMRKHSLPRATNYGLMGIKGADEPGLMPGIESTSGLTGTTGSVISGLIVGMDSVVMMFFMEFSV